MLGVLFILHATGLLDERWIVDAPSTLMTVVQEMATERKRD
jgi:hypothetical protein